MSYGIGPAGRQSSFGKCIKSSCLIQKSMLEPCSHLSFNSHLPKLIFSSIKTQSGSFQNSPITASSINCFHVATESFYDLLGISETGTLTEIKQSYKQLVLKYHPDVSPPEQVEEYTKRFIQLQEAYETLSDPKTRALYDKELGRGTQSHMVFSAWKQFHYKEELDERKEWRKQWQSQLTQLKRRSMRRDSMDNTSWAAKMRRRNRGRDDGSSD